VAASEWEIYKPQSSNDWEISNNEEQSPKQLGDIPFPLNIAMALSKPAKQAIPEHLQALGRGFTDIGEGIKQRFLSGKEKEDYTNQANSNRKYYEEKMGGNDIVNKSIREGAASSPYMAIGAPATKVGKNLLEKMLFGGITSGNIAASEFSPTGQINKEKIAAAGLMGAGIPAASKVLNIGEKGFEKLGNFIKKTNPKNLMYSIQRGADKMLSQSSDLFNLVRDEAKSSGMKIPIQSNLFDEVEKYLSKTEANKRLIEKAKTGDYGAIHTLQSDLGKKGTKYLGSESGADNNLGEEVLETRDKINESVRDHFNQYGRPDLSKLLDEATSKFRRMKEVYYKHPTIAKLVHHEDRIIPRNPLTPITEESKRTEELLKEHPEISESLSLINKLNKGKSLTKWALPSVAAAEIIRRKLF